MWRHYTYIHRRASNGKPFYVGKGTAHRKEFYRRAFTVSRRSQHWQRIVAKSGLVVEIVAHFISDIDAQVHEKALIAEIGRADLRRGPLINLTDGGDGHCGLVIPAHVLKIRSEHAKRPRSDAWIHSIRRARKNGGNGGVVKRGDKLPESWKRNIAKTKVGSRNPMFGRCGDAHPRAKQVVDTATGVSYGSIMAAASAIGIGFQNLHGMLTGHRENRTTMRLA